MIGVRVRMTTDGKLPLRELAAVAKNRKGLLRVLGAEGVKQLKSNFRKLGQRPNRLRAPSTGFWQGAAESTSFAVDGGEKSATLSVSQRGVRLQYHGGTVRPVRARMLAIPVHPDAHGKRPGDFSNLIPVRSARAAGLARPGPIGSRAAEWLFVFRRSVTVRRHPEVLPTDQVMGDAINARAAAWMQRQLNKANQS